AALSANGGHPCWGHSMPGWCERTKSPAVPTGALRTARRKSARSFSRMSTGPGRRMPFRRPRRAADKKLKRAICSKRVIRACRPSVTEKPESDLAGARERGEGGAVGLPAPRAVAVTHVLERAGDLVA